MTDFKFHKLNLDGQGKAQSIAGNFEGLLYSLEAIVSNPSPEMTICARKLEEACFYAKKAMALKSENQE